MTGKTTSSATSRPVVQGFPSPIGYLAELSINFEHHLGRIINAEMVKETKRIRKALARREPKWKDIAKDLDVYWDPQTLSFSYALRTIEAREKFKQLEYGPPAKSLLRHELLELNKTFGVEINKSIDKFLGNK